MELSSDKVRISAIVEIIAYMVGLFLISAILSFVKPNNTSTVSTSTTLEWSSDTSSWRGGWE